MIDCEFPLRVTTKKLKYNVAIIFEQMTIVI